MRICAFLLALSGAVIATGQDYISADALRDVGLTRYWQISVPLEADQRITSAYLVEDQLYLTTNDSYAFAVHAPTGAVRWMRPVGGGNYPIPQPCHVDGKTVFATPPKVTIYDKISGDPAQEFALRFPAGTGPITDGARYFIGGLDGRYYAFPFGRDFAVWKVVTQSRVVSRPVIYGEYLFVGSTDGRVFACRSADKFRHWIRATSGPIVGDLAANERGVYVPSQDQSLYLMALDTGTPRWRVRLSGKLDEGPVVTPDVVFQFVHEDGLVAIEADPLKRGERVRWKFHEGRKALTLLDGAVLVLTRDGRLVAIDLETGQPRGAGASANGLTIPVPSADNSTVFLASADGRVFCARPVGVEPLRVEQVRLAMQSDVTQPSEEEPETSAVATTTADDTTPSDRPAVPAIGGKSKVSKSFED
ncbi:MAG: PQQ-binding-like beta-propeller repeat protein [Phycisphaerales bacterium]|nr:PQQ-binding-like beta-propeller repeat protein [Phycisphaerales bacterium]